MASEGLKGRVRCGESGGWGECELRILGGVKVELVG